MSGRKLIFRILATCLVIIAIGLGLAFVASSHSGDYYAAYYDHYTANDWAEAAEYAALGALLSMDLTKAEFVRAVLDRPIEGLMDLAPIRAKCDATVFREGLV